MKEQWLLLKLTIGIYFALYKVTRFGSDLENTIIIL